MTFYSYFFVKFQQELLIPFLKDFSEESSVRKQIKHYYDVTYTSEQISSETCSYISQYHNLKYNIKLAENELLSTLYFE